MLAVDPRLAYISEPLNARHRPGVMRVPTPQWYTYICEDNDRELLPAFQETLQFKYHPWLELKSLRSRGKSGSLYPLLKDPFAVFSLNWFAEKLDCRVVIVVRHPAAVVSSLKRLGWDFNFDDLLQQPFLMRDWLEPYRDDMLAKPVDVIAQASLLWRMVYQVVAMLRDDHSEYILIRHEDISRDPNEEFNQLYHDLNLDYDQAASRAVMESSSESNPPELAVEDVHSTRLDSQANLENWKQRLNEAEITRVRNLTSDVAPLYYSDDEW
jgi:hypothetical protein